jgi:hypothetical protein
MDIYDPIGKALGLEPIEFNYDIKTYCPDQEIIPWNKGLTKEDPYVAEIGKRISQAKQNNPTKPWNKGLTKEDQRVRENSIKAANTKKQQGFYKDCGKYLPKLIGDKNHMKSSEHRKRMSELASRRYKKWNEDGSWTWGYRPL